jgi:hypothetical protein
MIKNHTSTEVLAYRTRQRKQVCQRDLDDHDTLFIINLTYISGILMCLEFNTTQSVSNLVAGYEDGTLIVWDVTRFETGVPIRHRIKLFSEPGMIIFFTLQSVLD